VPGRTVRSKGARSISAVGLARLLARLDANADRAADEYERLRRALIKFFDWRGAWPPEECADQTIDRLARKLEEDTDVDDLRSYARGIARLLLRERLRGPAFDSLDERGVEVASVPPAVDRDDDRREICLDRCLAALPADNRSLVLDYYAGDHREKISNRRRLAGLLGLTDNALRSRVQRLRDRLQICVEACASLPG